MKRTYEVNLECVVHKIVYCEGEDLTLKEVKKNPWEYAEDELETEQVDWEVLRVTDTTAKEKE